MLNTCSLLVRVLGCLVLASCFLASNQQEAVAQEQALRITVRDLATLVDLDGLSISPDGAWAVFQTRKADPGANAYTSEWRVVSIQGGKTHRVAGSCQPIIASVLGRLVGDIKTPAPMWSPDGKWIAYLCRQEGRTQIWRARADGRHSEQLTYGEADVRALVYSDDGRRILYQTEPSQAQINVALAKEGISGFRYDQRFSPVYSSTPVLPVDVDFSPSTGNELSTENQRRARGVSAYDIGRRSERPATEAEAIEFAARTAAPAAGRSFGYLGQGAASSHGALSWTEARDPDRRGGYAPVTIVAQPTNAATPIPCAAPECTGQRVPGLWWRNESEIIFARREGPSLADTVLYAWTPEDPARTRLILRTSGKLISEGGQGACAVAQDRLICFYEQSNVPRRLVAVNFDTGAIETLYDPNPGFARFDLGAPPRRLEIRSSSGVETYGYLVLPPHPRPGERLPLVIVTYRCSGFLRGGTGDEYPVYPFAAEGFAVLCFDVPDFDLGLLQRMDWTAAQNWARGPGDPGKRRVQEALDAAVAQLDSMGVIDPSRVGLTGLSFGGETVIYGLFNMQHLATAIASGGEFGPADFFLSGPAGRDLLRPWGLASETSPRWDKLSITRNAYRVRAPLLLNVSDHEMISVLHPVAALQEAGRAVEMYVFPNEYHLKWQPAHRLAIYNRSIDWMNFWLRSIEDADPAKAAQYERWRAMRSLGLSAGDTETPRSRGSAP